LAQVEEKRSSHCNPDACPNCLYIGEGDSMCDITNVIVLDNWIPTGADCPKTKPKKKKKKRAATPAKRKIGS
jgi:hypothetical protein